MTLLVLVFALLLGYLTARRTVYGVYAVLALLPSYLIRFTIGKIPSTLLEVSILAVALVWFCKLPHKKIYNPAQTRKLFLHSGVLTVWWYLTLFFILATTLAAFISPSHVAALGIWKAYFIEPLIFFSVCISTMRTRTELRTALDFLFIGVACAATISIIQKFTGWWIPNTFWQAVLTRRTTSVYGYPNAFPLIAAPLIPFIFFQIREHSSHIARSLYILLGLSMLLAILFTKSDGALAGLGAGLLVAGVWYKPTRPYIALFTFLTALTIFFIPPLKELFASHFLFQKFSGQLRLSMWQETLEMLKTHPLQGGGLANYQSAVFPYHTLQWAEIYLYPHNIFLNFWTETGLLGLLSFLTLVVFFFVRAVALWLKNHSFTVKTAVIAMIILLVHGLVDVPYFKNDLSVVFWLIIAIIVLEEKRILLQSQAS
ncbi:MAG: putative membrane protein [Candidatus Magasanikbacteria bacterium GW2011_GWC2_45_8]|uniref:Putative membrane protein n=1 Tax=Candidatus Magasanikbacteria bacterium GW2011_GWC2_45_8 TaxID=1619050 RepID=A0A0G1MX55_9BACT|nr:MAG: putative membrane protein [Candidatus Magasanikbacteria bacterium GW2011_GWC2_45_8]